jgi:hypothetical protein
MHTGPAEPLLRRTWHDDCMMHLHPRRVAVVYGNFGEGSILGLLECCRYGVFLTLATTLAITLCEVSDATVLHYVVQQTPCCKNSIALNALIVTSAMLQYVPNAPPGYHGTTLYFYSRIVDICLGITLGFCARTFG